jgi:hypothetical protein
VAPQGWPPCPHHPQQPPQSHHCPSANAASAAI